ncbi:polycomb group protein EMF2B-like isoform X2 [Phragmites australis]|uniref:polycomb group protein EMF2B-like isoform X2 n=1 Tax=Phragmites australis TaxID=29695 RepID=UPI002D7A0EA3|nr:polycomb group protein EMF2B-like isoform X2 [Phragmites australis]
MSRLTLPDDVATNTGCIYGSSSSSDQICHQQSSDELSLDSAEESLALYCQPVILYGSIQQRANQNPSFLQRNLHYKIHAKQKKRIQITLSLSGGTNAELQAHNIFPLYALFARPITAVLPGGHSPLYQFSRACLMTCFNESGSNTHTEATFIIPDLKTSASIILVSCGQLGQTLDENNCSKNHLENSSLQRLEGKCFWGKIPIGLLRSSLENCVDLSLGRTKEFGLTVIMNPGFIEPKFLEQDNCLTFCSRKFNAACSYELQVSVYAQEAGARDMFKSPYNFYLYNDVPPSSLLRIMRLRVGNVLFNYKHDNNICKTEVTEDFSCPFCLVKCGSFTGLEYHLPSSHDLFNFEFWVSEKEQGVNVQLKYRTWTNELFPAGVDPRLRTFTYFSKHEKHGRLVTRAEMIVPSKATEVIRHEHVLTTGSKSPEEAQAGFEDRFVQKENGISVADASIDPAHSLHGGNLSPPRLLQFGKTRKLSVDRSDPRNQQLLQKRQFFHSHKGQQMAFEEVLSDHDSEDEVDDDVADFEDRRMLGSFINIAKDDKRMMHMWNSFVRRQRVLADSHIPWACEAFSQLHGELFVQNPSLLRCWRLLMIKLWNHNLLDARTMNTCSIILDGFKNGGSDPK